MGTRGRGRVGRDGTWLTRCGRQQQQKEIYPVIGARAGWLLSSKEKGCSGMRLIQGHQTAGARHESF